MNKSILDSTKDDIKREMFENKRSYDYFMFAYFNMRALQILRNQGAVLFQHGKSIDEDFILRFNEDGNYPMLGTGTIDGKGISIWIGATMGLKENTTFVYKKELKILEGITYIEPQHVKKFVLY